jgi:hypothetical protein
MSPSTSLLAAAVIDKARRVRQMFDAQAPNELLWAHDELADALDEYDAANAPSQASERSGDRLHSVVLNRWRCVWCRHETTEWFPNCPECGRSMAPIENDKHEHFAR